MELRGNKSARRPLEDHEIVGLYWNRDEKAIEETDFKYKKYLMTVACNILSNRLDCEECLNDTYMGAWNSIPPSKPQVLRAFLTTIMRRRAVNRYHSNTRKGRVPSEMTVALSEIEAFATEEPTHGEGFDAARLGDILSDYLRSLSERRRFIFMSRYYAANTVDKIAHDLDMSRSTVNKELASIRNGLKEILEREGYII